MSTLQTKETDVKTTYKLKDTIKSKKAFQTENSKNQNRQTESAQGSDKNFLTSRDFCLYKSQIINNVRLYGMSEFQSPSTLQNSVYSWTFPKSDRFGNSYKKASVQSIYSLPDNKNNRSTSFGFGIRKVFTSNNRSPSPDRYNLPTVFDSNVSKRKGTTLTSKLNPLKPDSLNFPSPDKYNVRNDSSWKKDMQVKIKSRILYFYDEDILKQKHCISPQTYLPSTKIQENCRFNNITFGKGDRSPNENPYTLDIPGPGTYEAVSVFDKKRKVRPPLN